MSAGIGPSVGNALNDMIAGLRNSNNASGSSGSNGEEQEGATSRIQPAQPERDVQPEVNGGSLNFVA